MNDPSEVTIVVEADGPVLLIIFLVLALISIGIQILENSRQRRKLAVLAGSNQETRQRSRVFFYTVLILGLLTLVANYITGITSSLAASHIDDVKDPVNLLSLPGLGFTFLTLLVYAAAILFIAGLFLRNERIELPELLADLNDARKFGALDSPHQIAHYAAELEQLRQTRNAARAKQFTDGDFAVYFTSRESLDRPRVRQQLRHLRSDPQHRARTAYLLRRLLLNYRLSGGKWLLPFGLMAALSLYFTVQEAINANDGEPDYLLSALWAVAFVLGLAVLAGQFRCDVGRALLKSRKEFISEQTEAECRTILEQAAEDLSAPPAPAPAAPAGSGHDCGRDDWVPLLRIGRWEAGRRRPKGAG